jgi:hypothetical protein
MTGAVRPPGPVCIEVQGLDGWRQWRRGRRHAWEGTGSEAAEDAAIAAQGCALATATYSAGLNCNCMVLMDASDLALSTEAPMASWNHGNEDLPTAGQRPWQGLSTGCLTNSRWAGQPSP